MPSSIAGTSSPSFSRTRSGSEASRPVDGFVLDVADVDGRAHEVHLTRADTRARTRAHETRWTELLESFERALLEPVVVESSDESELLRAFLRWSELRQAGADAW